MTTWALLHQDNFNRANGALNSSTFSDAIGVWSNPAATSWTVNSNQGFNASKADNTGIWDDAMSAVDKQAVQGLARSLGCGFLVRHNEVDESVGSPGYYFLYRDDLGGGNDVIIQKYASGFFTLSGTYSATSTDTVRLEADGADLTLLVNDVAQETVNDGSYATGVAGMFSGGFNATLDDFKVYIDDTLIAFFGGIGGTCGGRLTA